MDLDRFDIGIDFGLIKTDHRGAAGRKILRTRTGRWERRGGKRVFVSGSEPGKDREWCYHATKGWRSYRIAPNRSF